MKNRIHIYNSSLEIGTRALLILTYFEENKFDIEQLVFFDYILLYAKDFNGPENIHPVVPNHIAEITHRREILPSALKLFMSRKLIDMEITKDGFFYTSSSDSLSFVSCLKSAYYKKIWNNLDWIDENFELLDSKRFSILSEGV